MSKDKLSFNSDEHVISSSKTYVHLGIVIRSMFKAIIDKTGLDGETLKSVDLLGDNVFCDMVFNGNLSNAPAMHDHIYALFDSVGQLVESFNKFMDKISTEEGFLSQKKKYIEIVKSRDKNIETLRKEIEDDTGKNIDESSSGSAKEKRVKGKGLF